MRHIVFRVRQIFREFFRHWKASVMGPVVGIGSLLWEHWIGQALSWSWFLILILCGVIWDMFSVLREERKRARTTSVAIPELYLQYSPNVPNALHCSGFYLRTENERKAWNVESSSKDTTGDGHVRLGMRWENPGQPIGKDAIPVKVECVYFKDGNPHTYSSLAADQINLFFKHKKDNPRELIVTLNYTDVGGDRCPPRDFLVSQDIWKEGKISCQPVKN